MSEKERYSRYLLSAADSQPSFPDFSVRSLKGNSFLEHFVEILMDEEKARGKNPEFHLRNSSGAIEIYYGTKTLQNEILAK